MARILRNGFVMPAVCCLAMARSSEVCGVWGSCSSGVNSGFASMVGVTASSCLRVGSTTVDTAVYCRPGCAPTSGEAETLYWS